MADALALIRRSATLYRQAGDQTGLAASLDHQGKLLASTGKSKAALAAFAEEEAIAQAALDRATLQNCLGNIADVLIQRRRLGEVIPRLDEREALCRELADPRGLALTFLQRAEYFGTVLKQTDLALDFIDRAAGVASANGVNDVAEKAREMRTRVIAARLR